MSNILNERKKESYKIFDQIAHRYDFLNRALSLGIDIYWRKQLRKWLPQKDNLKVLDLATGTADVALELAKDPRVQSIEGIDPSIQMLEIGKEKLKTASHGDKIKLEIGNGENIQRNNNLYDVTTVSFGIRNYGDPLQGLKEKLRVLKPGGCSLILEFGIPQAPIIKQLYLLYFRYILPIFGNLLSQHSDAYTYLNETAESFPFGTKFIQLMQQAGYCNIKSKNLTFGIAILYKGEKSE